MPALQTAGNWVAGFFGFGQGRAANAYPGSTVNEQYPARPELSLDQKDLLQKMQHRQLLNSGRHIWNAFPMVSGAVNDIANHAVGQSWQPQSKSKDDEWADKMESWVGEYSKICDVRGHPFTLTTNSHVGIVTICRDGEYFLYLTSNIAGYPMIQMIESHRIGSRFSSYDGRIPDGPFRGLTQRNGIAYNAYSRPVGYHFLGDRPEDDMWIPSTRMIHIYDPKWFSQGRGISPLVYGILDWLDVSGWRGNEKAAQMIISSIALLEQNEDGAPNTLQARMKAKANGSTAEPEKAKQFVESFQSGMTRFLKINGSNVRALETNRPSQNQADFEERVLRGCFRALGWTYEQAYNSKGQGGANVRRDVAQNQKSVEHYQDIVKTPWLRTIIYAIAAANALDILIDEDGNKIELVKDWYKWRPQLPQKMTVDHGRDRRVDIEEIRTGARTMIQDIRDRGGDESQHLDEQVKFYKLKRLKAEEHGISKDEWPEVFGSLLHNQPSAQSTDDDDEDDEEKKKKPTNDDE